jgi:hypothetical protein
MKLPDHPIVARDYEVGLRRLDCFVEGFERVESAIGINSFDSANIRERMVGWTYGLHTGPMTQERERQLGGQGPPDGRDKQYVLTSKIAHVPILSL